MITKIPIDNIYYLLCYAWNRLEERDMVAVNETGVKDMINLLGRILASGTGNLLKRGLDRGYITEAEELRGIRGKLEFSNSMRRMSFERARAYCRYDELSYNVLHNRILKTTIMKLIKSDNIDVGIRKELSNLYRYFGGVDEINLSLDLFSKVQINRNNKVYGLIMDICSLLFENLMIDEKTGRYKLKDFQRDESQMNRLYEEFVRNFYMQEQNVYRVRREDIQWQFGSNDAYAIGLLPKMQTDITLESRDRKIIIDTKYYTSALQRNFDTEKLISSNLYQMFAYLKNVEAKGGELNKNCEGVLLYPTTDKELDLEYHFEEHKLRVKTINLSMNWREIYKELLEVVDL